MVSSQGIRLAQSGTRQPKIRSTREEPLRFDFLVEGCVLVEVKAVEKVLAIYKAQLLSYMKLLNIPLGLLINFHEEKVADEISRLILPGANR